MLHDLYMKESIDQIVKLFESDTAVSQTIVLETAAAVQMKIDEVHQSLEDIGTQCISQDSIGSKVLQMAKSLLKPR